MRHRGSLERDVDPSAFDGGDVLDQPADAQGAARGHGAGLLVGEAVGGDPQDGPLLGQIGRQALALVGNGVHVSRHGPNPSFAGGG